MRTLAAACLVLLLVPGCPLTPSCGGFSGGGDTVYRRGADALTLCENGGFVASGASTAVEGTYHTTAPGSAATGFGIRGDDGQLAFDLTANPDGSATLDGLGGGIWQPVALGQVELDHANIQCTDLETRSWWKAP